jgi:type II secretory pathway component PulF
MYRYEALTAGGEKSTGVIEAESPRDAKGRLRQQDLHVTMLESATYVQRRASTITKLRRFNRRRLMEVEEVTRQLAMLLENEVKLTDALAIAMSEARDKKILLAMRDIRDRVANGSSVADAMQPHQWLFGQMYISMVRVGETAGTLPQVLRTMADHLRERGLRQAALSTVLVYPAVMMLVAIGVVTYLLTNVFPKLQSIFKETERELPLPTQVLMFASDTLIHYWWLVLALLVIVVASLTAFLRQESGRRLRDQLALKTPVLGDLIRKMETAQFTSTLGTLLGSGVKMADSMTVLLETAGNVFMKDTINDLRESIIRGSDVSTVLRRSKIFPRGVAHMVAVGEQSGELEKVLERLTINLNSEVEITMARLNALMQPLVILFLAVVVGFIVAATMLPIMEMSSL